MGVLGRGLASLIPKRNRDNAEDVLEQIDNMEFEVQANTQAPAPKQDPLNYRKVNVMSDFEELEKIEAMPMPEKPLTTSLPFDPFEEEGGAEAVIKKQAEAKAQKKTLLKVQAEEDTSVITKAETAPVSEEVELEAPEEVKETPIAPEVAPIPEPEGKEDMATPSFGEGGGNIWDQHEQQVEHVATGDIKINPLQPRRSFDPQELEDLMRSIEQHGILQPLVVHRLSGNQGFELIAGERRLRAAKKLGWDKVPAVVRRDVKSDQSRLVFALIENIQRENLNPIEEALAYQQLNQEYGLTHEEIGHRVGKSRVAITNIVRILQLPAEIQRGLTEGKITTGHAKAILMIPDGEKQIKFYQHLLDEGLTVRKAEVRARRIQRTMNLHDPLRDRRGTKHPLAIKYSPALEERYGYDAKVRHVQEQNKFEVVFKAHNESEVEELVGMLLGTKPLAHGLDKDVTD